MKNNIIQEKTFDFALSIIEIYKKLVNEKNEYVMSKQLLKSATSIGANVEEAIGGQSKRDFYMKISIAYKEARETHYWIRLLVRSNFLNNLEYDHLEVALLEIIKILGATKKTIERQLKEI